MRANVVRGDGFRGALNYALASQKNAMIVGGNLEGQSPRELASEFAVSRSLRPDCVRPVWHCSLSAPEIERPSPEQWGQAAELLLHTAGLSPERHQYVVVRHGDAAHDHVHVYASRIGLDGTIWHGQHEASLAQDATDRIERELGLTITRDRKSPRFQPKNTVKCSKRETEMWARKGVDIPPKYFIAVSLDGALESGVKSWGDLAGAMELDGIELKKNKRGAGYRLNYVEPVTGEECSYKASDIGKAYSFKRVALKIEENMNGKNQRTPGEGQNEIEAGSAPRDIDVPHEDQSQAGRSAFDAQNDSRSNSHQFDFNSADSSGGNVGQRDPDVGNHSVVGVQIQQPGDESVQLGQGCFSIPEDAPGNSRVDSKQSLSVKEEFSMDREAMKIQVQEAIKEVLPNDEGNQIELMKFAAALKERQIEAKLHYNERLNKIMGFGLDVEGEHFQGHEVGIPWQSVRERLILPDAMKKMDKPVLTISPSSSTNGEGLRRTCQEALESARRRAPELFDDIEMSEEEGLAFFSNAEGQVQFYEHPDGNSIQVNENTYEAVAAALVYGHEKWEGDIEVTRKDPEFAALCLKAADQYGIPISNREELERIVHGDMKPVSSPKESPKIPFTAYAETLEKLIEYEGYASLGDNEAIKAGLREKLDKMAQQGVESSPQDVQVLAEKLASQLGYPEQAEAAEEYLQKVGHVATFEDHNTQRLGMAW